MAARKPTLAEIDALMIETDGLYTAMVEARLSGDHTTCVACMLALQENCTFLGALELRFEGEAVH